VVRLMDHVPGNISSIARRRAPATADAGLMANPQKRMASYRILRFLVQTKKKPHGEARRTTRGAENNRILARNRSAALCSPPRLCVRLFLEVRSELGDLVRGPAEPPNKGAGRIDWRRSGPFFVALLRSLAGAARAPQCDVHS
jgi:hypothetical protein